MESYGVFLLFLLIGILTIFLAIILKTKKKGNHLFVMAFENPANVGSLVAFLSSNGVDFTLQNYKGVVHIWVETDSAISDTIQYLKDNDIPYQ